MSEASVDKREDKGERASKARTSGVNERHIYVSSKGACGANKLVKMRRSKIAVTLRGEPKHVCEQRGAWCELKFGKYAAQQSL